MVRKITKKTLVKSKNKKFFHKPACTRVNYEFISEKTTFYNELYLDLINISKKYNILLMGDFNARLIK